MPNHFSFTKVVVRDLDASAAFYESVFGLTEQYRVTGSVAGRPMKEIICGSTAPGGGSFILLQYTDGDPPPTDGVIVGFRTDDIEGLFARGVAAGGAVAQPIAPAPEYGVLLGFLADVEGRLIEVVEALPEGPGA